MSKKVLPQIITEDEAIAMGLEIITEDEAIAMGLEIIEEEDDEDEE